MNHHAMPEYVTKRRVRALRIKTIETGRDFQSPAMMGLAITLYFVEEGFEPVRVDEIWARIHQPRVGGYYIFHEDADEATYMSAEFFEQQFKLVHRGE